MDRISNVLYRLFAQVFIAEIDLVADLRVDRVRDASFSRVRERLNPGSNVDPIAV